MSALVEVLLPSTDAGALAQTVTVAVTGLVGLVLVRRSPEGRLMVLGVAVVMLGFMGLRALH